MKGNISNNNSHLKINNVILTSDEKKEEAHREIWKNVFRISPDENRQFDLETERMVKDYLNDDIDKITIFQNTDVNRLHEGHLLTQPISLIEVKNTIKSFKTNTRQESIKQY